MALRFCLPPDLHHTECHIKTLIVSVIKRVPVNRRAGRFRAGPKVKRCTRINGIVPRVALHRLRMSVWSTLSRSLYDQELITMTSLDHSAFQYLLTNLKSLYDTLVPYSTNRHIKHRNTKLGRKRIMSACAIVRLALAWYCTRGSMYTLCILFEITDGLCSLHLRSSCRLLVKALSVNERARLKIPVD